MQKLEKEAEGGGGIFEVLVQEMKTEQRTAVVLFIHWWSFGKDCT
jgi:hypothetical protein